MKIQKTSFSSYKINEIADGCKLCITGAKSVLFITGLCKRGCYYCPLPESRKQKDVVYINERKLSNPNAVNEAIEEIKLCESAGVGITGGDPLLALNRVEKFVKSFKKKFGKKSHVHIYLPTQNITKEKLKRLAKSGIDEIRFHPNFLNFTDSERKKIDLALELKKKYHWKVGVEIPVIPGTEKKMISFIKKIQDLDFLNLNELEMGTLNTGLMHNKGFIAIEEGTAIKQSKEEALKILKAIGKTKLRIHFCTAKTKEAFQYLNRLKRRLKNVKKPFDIITRDNDLLRGVIYSSIKPSFDYNKKLNGLMSNKIKLRDYVNNLHKLINYLEKEYDIPKNLIEIDKDRLRILTSVEIIEKLKDEIKKKGFYPAIVTEIPAYDLPILQLEWL
jgi:hypothetical protein